MLTTTKYIETNHNENFSIKKRNIGKIVQLPDFIRKQKAKAIKKQKKIKKKKRLQKNDNSFVRWWLVGSFSKENKKNAISLKSIIH